MEAKQPSGGGRRWLMLAVATVGFAVNFWAWALTGRFGGRVMFPLVSALTIIPEPGRPRGADPAAGHHHHRDRADTVRQPLRSRLRLPHHRRTVVRGLFSGSPDVTAIANAPVIYQVHAASAWLIWAVWPFSRLVHAWSVPVWYLWRPDIVYRSRRPAPPAEPGTSGRRWRKIGVPY